MLRIDRPVAVCCLLLFAISAHLFSEDYTVSYRGHEATLSSRHVQGANFLPLGEVVDVLGGDLRVFQDELLVRWEFAGERIEFSHQSPVYSVGRRMYNLPVPCSIIGGEFLVPVRFLTRDLKELFPDIFTYEVTMRSLRDIRSFAHLRSFHVEAGMTTTVVSLATTSPVEFALDNTRPGSFLVNLYHTRMSRAVEDSITGAGYIDSVRVIPYPDGSQIMFYLDERAEEYRVAETTEPLGMRIVFSGKKLEAGVEVPVAPGGDRERRPIDYSIRTIMIDPGHGGKDPGAVSPNGVREKDVNLKVARLLADRLEREGYTVFMTRDGDTFVPLSTRTKMANERGADMFVSIHCNSSSNKNLHGFEVYFLSEAKTDEERAVAHRENMSLRYERPDLDPGTLGDIQFIFWDLAQNEFLYESYECAQIIAKEVSEGLDYDRTDVRQAGFYVLNGVFMPSVLIELAYLSNNRDRLRITSDDRVARLVDHLFSGLTEYISVYNRKVNG